MFGHSYFGAAYFGPSYFGQSSGTAPVATTDTLGGHRKRRPPDEIAREQRMVDAYLLTLERPKLPKKKRPVLTETMVEAATDTQLQRLVESAAIQRERELAEIEHRKRYWAAFLTLAMHH